MKLHNLPGYPVRHLTELSPLATHTMCGIPETSTTWWVWTPGISVETLTQHVDRWEKGWILCSQCVNVLPLHQLANLDI